MDQKYFEMLIKKAENNHLDPLERLELTHEINIRLAQYNKLLEKALAEVLEENQQ